MSERGRVVITRREGERIFVGSEIEITVTHARSGKARVLVSAPRELGIGTPGTEVDRSDRDSLKAYKGITR